MLIYRSACHYEKDIINAKLNGRFHPFTGHEVP